MLITLVGSDQLFRRFPHRTRVQISLLPPLIPERDENPLAFTDRLMFTLAGGLPPEMRGVYNGMPAGFGGWEIGGIAPVRGNFSTPFCIYWLH